MDVKPARFEYFCTRPDQHHKALLAAVEQFAEERALEQRLRYHLGVIVDELVMNCITHGGCSGENHSLSVTLDDEPKLVALCLVDSGRPFDPASHPLPNCPKTEKDVSVGGVGLCLVRRFCDDLQYTRTEDHNEVRLFLYKTKTEDLCS
jgi:serine/threonine-protein kinase RsbW